MALIEPTAYPRFGRAVPGAGVSPAYACGRRWTTVIHPLAGRAR
jgi:hypothetical protein